MFPDKCNVKSVGSIMHVRRTNVRQGEGESDSKRLDPAAKEYRSVTSSPSGREPPTSWTGVENITEIQSNTTYELDDVDIMHTIHRN
jgi:hypothetical protein